jgi:tRNA 2-selenouridine synthase
VFVEGESKKVGNVAVPESLILAMRSAPCLNLELPLLERVSLLMEDYEHFVLNIDVFCERLETLTPLRGKEVVQRWMQQAQQGQLDTVVRELLISHYDPVYLQSMQRNFARGNDNISAYYAESFQRTWLQGAATALLSSG